MKKLVPERKFLIENRKLDKLNDSLFLQNCELKRKESEDKKYIELLQNRNIDAVIEKDRIKKENEEYKLVLEETKNNLNKTISAFTKDKINLEKTIEGYEELTELYQKERKNSKKYIEELEKSHKKLYVQFAFSSVIYTVSMILILFLGALK